MKAVLEGRRWIATYAPDHGRIDRVEFDLDCEGSGVDVVERDHRYWRLRDIFGRERKPLVVRTPSTSGLRVIYRIPDSRLEDLIEGLECGLVTDVLRAAGLRVKRGEIEVFPQRRQCNRLPVGRQMAILDPETLEAYGDAVSDDRLTLETAWGFLKYLEEWHSQPVEDLVGHLRGLPRRQLQSSQSPSGSRVRSRSHPNHPPERQSGTSIDPALRKLIANGLPGPSTRYSTEFKVGMAMWIEPELFSAFGLPSNPTREDVATSLPRWLAEKHNGCSQEWAESLRGRNPAEVLDLWKRRYLTPGSGCGEAPVDRMRRAALGAQAQHDELDLDLPHPLDIQDIREIAAELFPPGPNRYHFEVWTCCLLVASKSVVRYRRRNGQVESRPEDPGYVTVEISADWMEGWPWGAGEIDGRRAYLVFRDGLIAKGWLAPIRQAIRPVQGLSEQPGTATIYRVRAPRVTTVKDLQLPRELLHGRIRDFRIRGRQLTEVEAYHALEVEAARVHVRRTYGEPTASHVARLLNRLRNPFAPND